MRVALACDWFLPRMGGIELHLRDLANALRSHGIEAEVVTTTRGPDVVDGVRVRRVPATLSPVGGFAATPASLDRVARAVTGQGYDLVHAHASVVSPVAYTAAVAASRAGIPAVLTFHSMLHRAALVLGAADATTSWARRGVVLTAVSSVVATQAARWLPGADVGVLPNGIDAGFWRADAGASGERPEGALTFVTAMRLSRKKRADHLLRAFADTLRFVGTHPSLCLVIAGDGPDRGALQRLAAELGVRDRVQFTGAVSREELRALYARADVFVLPSERESFGIAALEARAAGMPVIAMLAGGARDFIQPGVNGLLARNADELAIFMRRMALDAPFRSFVRARNLATAPPYDWPDVAGLHATLYDVAVRRAGTTSPIHR